MTTPAAPGRGRLTAYAAWQLLLALPTLLVFALSLVGGVLMVVWAGIGILLVTLPASRWLADRHREMAARVLGTPLPAGYRPLPPGGPIKKLQAMAADPMTWRVLAWMLASVTVGFVLALLTVLLLLGVVTSVIWWYGVGPIMWARSAMDRFFLVQGRTERLEERVQVLTETRAEAVDHSAAELRRIERDLHDGAQARLVALSMNLGMVDDLLESDPERARRLVSEARTSTRAALGELRDVVRGIHPPVLADRGIGGAVEALAIDMAIPVSVTIGFDGRPPAPVESAVYFAIAECLANVGKHSFAENAWVELTHDGTLLLAVVGDDGQGGADADGGTGMRGVMRRLSSFDGTMRVSSPDRGPTIVTLEIPCDLSSPKTTPS